jgi:hypothetical protein
MQNNLSFERRQTKGHNQDKQNQFKSPLPEKKRARELWRLTSLSKIFQLYRGSQFYWWRRPKYLEKTLTCRKSLANFIP